MLPTISKIVECVAQTQLLKFLEDTAQLNMVAHAYRKNMSTATTITAITDELYMATEGKKISQLMTIDQSSAFDCINHDTLLRKLKLYNLSDSAIEWVRNYLSMRTQFVTIGAAKSRMRGIYKGVPQGSVIGPLLYAIYINKMTETVLKEDCDKIVHLRTDRLFGEPCTDCGTINMYADDATFNTSSKTRRENKSKIERTLTEMRKFLSFALEHRKNHYLGMHDTTKEGETIRQPTWTRGRRGTRKVEGDQRQGDLQNIGSKLGGKYDMDESPGNR